MRHFTRLRFMIYLTLTHAIAIKIPSIIIFSSLSPDLVALTLVAPSAVHPNCLQTTMASLSPASRSQACPNELDLDVPRICNNPSHFPVNFNSEKSCTDHVQWAATFQNKYLYLIFGNSLDES